jgi:hypothetical protein
MKSLLVTLLVLVSSAYAYAQDDAGAAGTDRHAELEKVKAAFKETWVHPDADFTEYDKVYLWKGEFQYRDVGPAQRTRSSIMNTRKREFGISDADREKFESAVSEAFIKEIQKGKRFTITDTVGPDTLILRGAALDIISRVPPDTVGRSEIYLASIGEATLVLELMDAETGDVLALVAERRAMGNPSGQIDMMTTPTNSATALADVRRWARQAAIKLRSELDKAMVGK